MIMAAEPTTFRMDSVISTHHAADRTSPVKAVHTWSLFRTLGRYVAPGSMPSSDLPEAAGNGLTLLDLAGALAEHGYRSAQLCHFYFRRRRRIT